MIAFYIFKWFIPEKKKNLSCPAKMKCFKGNKIAVNVLYSLSNAMHLIHGNGVYHIRLNILFQ